MSLNNKNIDSDIFVEFLKIKEKFLLNDDIDVATYVLMKDVLKFFDIDRIYVGMKSSIKSQCVPIVEYLRGEEPNFLGDVMDFSSYTKFININMTFEENEYIKVCDDNNYLLEEDFKKIENTLSHLGYIPSEKGVPKECLMFYIRNKVSFSFLFMERYEDRDKTFSKLERTALADIYSIIKTRIQKESLEERLYNEINIKNIIIENEQTPICMVDKDDHKIIYYNETYKDFIPNIEIGASYYDLFDKEHTVELLENSESLILQNYTDDLTKYWIKKVTPFKLADGKEVFMIYIKNTEDYIKELEGIDLLTSAYSMAGFTKCFKNLMDKNPSQNYTLCTIDISKFKYINDSFSFNTGNKILRKTANELNKFVRSQEAFCRMNEDKFAILFQSNTKEELKARIKGLFANLETMREQHFLDVKLTYICGITDVDKNVEINILIDRANMARKSVKNSHKNTMAFFDEKAAQKAREELSIEASVSKAIANGEFVPYLQPKFDLKTMKICGAEALVRWITPTGMIFPDSFIPLFERNGFISTLDFIIYQKVMEHIRECLDKNIKVYPISLNVSRNHIQNKNFVNQVMELIDRYRVPVDLIELEVTESVFIEDRETLKYFIDNIKRPKIKVSIDDFGTAYSSLQILKDIDIDILKIDKGFLENIDFTDTHKFTKDEVVLKNIINLARDLNCRVICEGIETEEQIELLKSIGCEYGQGYVFSRPIPIYEYTKTYL
ncbi:MAG: bifunctional diguanylate cyclase/phosphodiesterase [bacterium]